MTQPAQPTPIRNGDQLVDLALELAEKIEQHTEQLKNVKAQLAELYGIGSHKSTGGVPVVVQAPSRKFNADKAWGLLTPEQQAACTGPIPVKIKGQLAPVLVDLCMEPGTGNPTVKVG